jgi:phosphoglycerol transferase
VPHVGYKVPVEAELYGLKIRRMLVPHPRNPIPPLSAWASRDAQASFPNENENQSVRLGIFGALGFLFLIWVSVTSPARHANGTYDTLGAVAALNLIALLVVTVGGFGAIINTLTVPDIRAYNRFSVFLAFFATAGLSLWLGHLWSVTRRLFKPWLAVAVLAIGGLSLYDQVMDARWIAGSYERDRAVAAEVDAVLTGMEARFPQRTRVFQFPVTEFPVDAGRERMLSYDHALPYLQSDHFDWSWPSFSPRHLGWTRFIATLHGEALVRALAAAGFDALWVDRFGYRDGGRAVTEDVVSGGAVEVLPGTSQRYAVYDIRGAARGTGRRPGVGGVRPSLSQTP